MKSVASEPFQQPGSAAPVSSSNPAHAADATASFWLDRLFLFVEYAPGFVRLCRGLLSRVAFRYSTSIRAGTLANAAHILGPDSSPAQREALARRVIGHFILFCHDIGRSMHLGADDLLGQIEQIDGHEHYVAARSKKRGAIVVTAHLGSFEIGMAALRRQDARVHVVFRRDVFGRFERMRAALRAKLGVIETPVDDGWTIWIRLRDALLKDEVVVLQADRVMPGQKGQQVDVLGAPMMLPAGPVKLALATGAPIVPVFSLRTPSGKLRLCVEPAIQVEMDGADGLDRAMEQLARVIGKYISGYGDQWLMLQPAWSDGAETTPP